MIWEKHFLTRFALVIFSAIAAIFWLILGVVSSTGATDFDLIYLILFVQSLGMMGLCAGLFGQQKWALLVNLVLGLCWFSMTLPFLQQFINLLSAAQLSALCNFWGLTIYTVLTCSGFALFFITWLLLRASRQVSGDFRDF